MCTSAWPIVVAADVVIREVLRDVRRAEVDADRLAGADPRQDRAAARRVAIQRNAAARFARKFTNGPAAVALASHSLGWNAAAIACATCAGSALGLRDREAADREIAELGRGVASTLSSLAGTPACDATASAAAA